MPFLPIATETDPTDPNRRYEYAITRDGATAKELECPDKPFVIVMRIAREDGTFSDYENACMGYSASEEKAMERFAERVQPGRLTLTFQHFTAETIYATNHDRIVAREALNEAFRQMIKCIQVAAETAESERKARIDAAFVAAHPKFKREMVRLDIDRVRHPDAPELVKASVYCGLAIHQAWDASARGSLYHVSHVVSGKAVGRGGMTLKDARLCVWRLSGLTDWMQDEGTVLKALNESGHIEKVVLAIVHDVYAAIPITNHWDKPCAATGLESYRYRSAYGWIMIGANSIDEALREAARSTQNVTRANLEMWIGHDYVKVARA